MRRAAALAVLLSSFGLTGLTYGFIRAGQDGWGSPAALAAIAAGAALLAVLVAWERQVSRRGTGQPLVELALFRSPGFTWGCILTTLVSFALFGILFAMPQYFQDVRGLNALGGGLRLLPMIGGMVAGMLAATRLQNTRQAREGTVDVSGLPTQAASAVRNGIAGGIAADRVRDECGAGAGPVFGWLGRAGPVVRGSCSPAAGVPGR